MYVNDLFSYNSLNWYDSTILNSANFDDAEKQELSIDYKKKKKETAIKDLEENEYVSWPKFAFHVYQCITDRNTDEGLRTLFDLFIDDPEKDTITLETFRRICKDVGDNVSDEELRNILEITTQSGNDISFDDFCQYMKLTA